MQSIGIIGGGFSGLSCLAALVRHAWQPLQITVYHPDSALGRGKAYSTQDPEHLLNVRAVAMGAHAGQDADFHDWLVAQDLSYGPADFVPRAVYGRYVDHVLAQTLVAAQAKGIRIFMVHETAHDVRPHNDELQVITAPDAHNHDAVIVACGNDRPRVPALAAGVSTHKGWWPHPYQTERYDTLHRAGHIIIIGAGLSMIDALVTLRRMQYDGDITAISRHGHIPMAHLKTSTPFTWDAQEALALTSPAHILRQVRRRAALAAADWRDVLDGLRPYANDIWRGFSPVTRARAQKYMSFWNNHRHRIPEVMHDMVRDLTEQGQLRLLSGRVDEVKAMGNSLNVYTSAGVLEGQIVMNCLGYDYSIKPHDGSLLARLHEGGMINLQEGFPQPVNASWQMHPQYPLYGVGPLWQGHLIESTAVRDIRLQADDVARALLLD